MRLYPEIEVEMVELMYLNLSEALLLASREICVGMDEAAVRAKALEFVAAAVDPAAAAALTRTMVLLGSQPGRMC